jgi:hypothetical protein
MRCTQRQSSLLQFASSAKDLRPTQMPALSNTEGMGPLPSLSGSVLLEETDIHNQTYWEKHIISIILRNRERNTHTHVIYTCIKIQAHARTCTHTMHMMQSWGSSWFDKYILQSTHTHTHMHTRNVYHAVGGVIFV